MSCIVERYVKEHVKGHETIFSCLSNSWDTTLSSKLHKHCPTRASWNTLSSDSNLSSSEFQCWAVFEHEGMMSILDSLGNLRITEQSTASSLTVPLSGDSPFLEGNSSEGSAGVSDSNISVRISFPSSMSGASIRCFFFTG